MMPADLRKLRNRATVKFLEFTRLFTADRDVIFCFFEGEDSKYYYIRIKDHCVYVKSHFFDCGGKQQLLKLKELIANNDDYSAARCLYFIDKDFDENESAESMGIYVTPTYSVENFYTSKEVFHLILVNEFKLSTLSLDYSNCQRIFNERLEEFHSKILLLNAWIACQRDEERTRQIKAQLNLSNYNLTHFVAIKLEGIVQKYDLAKLAATFTGSFPVSEETVGEKVLHFSKLDLSAILRGKYEIEFFRTIILQLKKDICAARPILFSKKQSIPLNLSRDNILSELSQYADTPQCLIDYLSSH